MKPEDILLQAAEVISERGAIYGDVTHNLQLAADLTSLRLGRPVHPYEIAVMMVCAKNARAFVTPDHADSHLDAAVYEVFAQLLSHDYTTSEARNGVQVRFRIKEEQRPASVTPIRPTRAAKKPADQDILAEIAKMTEILPSVARDAE